MNFTQAFEAASAPLRQFMLLVHARRRPRPDDPRGWPGEPGGHERRSMLTTLIPAFMISELRAAFIIGFVIFVPFLVIDLVVAAALMSMGMMMLPPVMISLPFKILLFVLVDGWGLIITSLISSYGTSRGHRRRTRHRNAGPHRGREALGAHPDHRAGGRLRHLPAAVDHADPGGDPLVRAEGRRGLPRARGSAATG
jgi:hypothetical protein